MRVRATEKRFKDLEKPLSRVARRVFDFLGRRGELDVYVVSGSKMRSLNKHYRGKDKGTDVLAIEPPKGFPNEDESLGEIYLSPTHIDKKPHDIDFALVHGILHLLGFNHQNKSDKMEMEKQEKEILEWLNHTS